MEAAGQQGQEGTGGEAEAWRGQGPCVTTLLASPDHPSHSSCFRACPGTASTAATKELAQLWRVMTPQERRPYW